MSAPRPALRGRKLGDRRVVVARPHSDFFRYAGPGTMVAKASASAPRTGFGRFLASIRGIVFGKPLANAMEIEERLSKKKALAIFSSDAISSSAYATDEILKVLILVGVSALVWSIQIAAAVAILLAIVAFSYRQVCRAYPGGGGAYVVVRQKLGPGAGLIAAAALMIDYVMTVAVSTASAIANLASAFPDLNDAGVELAVASVAIVAGANLRGIRESGNIFALPTYLFVGSALLAIGVGVFNTITGNVHQLPPPEHALKSSGEALSVLLIGRAFASGSVALTGVEAIADGVPSFKPPEPKNAANTLVAMATLLGVLFIGLTFVGIQYGVMPTDDRFGPTVLGQVGGATFGEGSLMFFVLQMSAGMILFLAANTSFNAFPRLAAILAKDGYIPRQFSYRGDRLAFSWGIVVLAILAICMLVAFGADTHALIPLYSVGVFICFTLAQTAMVLHWRADRGPGWRWRSLVNGFGAVLTGVVFVVVASEKFVDGAWMVLVTIPVLIAGMVFVSHQYATAARQLEVPAPAPLPRAQGHARVVIPVSGVNRSVGQVVDVAMSISSDVRAVYIADDAESAAGIRRRWTEAVPEIPLVVVESPYRALIAPMVAYMDVLERSLPAEDAPHTTYVLIPEYFARHWWERMLYNQAAKRLRTSLIGRPNTVVVAVPFRRDDVSAEALGLVSPAGTLVEAESINGARANGMPRKTGD
jgi:amino acid transporter